MSAPADMLPESCHDTRIPDHEFGLWLYRARGGRPDTVDLGGQLDAQQWDRNIRDIGGGSFL